MSQFAAERFHLRPPRRDSTPPSVQIQGGSADGDESVRRDAATESGEPAWANVSWQHDRRELIGPAVPDPGLPRPDPARTSPAYRPRRRQLTINPVRNAAASSAGVQWAIACR